MTTTEQHNELLIESLDVDLTIPESDAYLLQLIKLQIVDYLFFFWNKI